MRVLDQLERMERKLGPSCDWHVIHGNEIVDEDGEEVAYAASGPRAEERAAFIAAVRNVLPDLIAIARSARQAITADGSVVLADCKAVDTALSTLERLSL